MNILLLQGGRSAERDVSIVSAGYVRRTLEKSGHRTVTVEIDPTGGWSLGGENLSIVSGSCPWELRTALGEKVVFDLLFPVLHGPLGEDGTLQGLCEMAGWPYAGSGVMTSSMAMNKAATKMLAAAWGIPVLPWILLEEGVDPADSDLSQLSFPLFVKPARMGSSVGISRVGSNDGLEEAVQAARRFDSLVIIEKGLTRPREIEVGLLSLSSEVSASVTGEVVPGLEWYDYSAKYDCDDSRTIIPAQIPESIAGEIRDMAVTLFGAMHPTGFARADFLMDGDDIYFNEINTIPGFTEISMFARLWAASGIPGEELLQKIITEAMRVHSIRRMETDRCEIT